MANEPMGDEQRLDELEAELAAHSARPLRIRGVDRESGDVVEGIVYGDHAIAAGLIEHERDDGAT